MTGMEQDAALSDAVFDALPMQTAVLNEAGVIVTTNRAWREFAEANGMTGTLDSIGENYLAVCETGADSEMNAAAEGLRAVLSGEQDVFTLEYPCHSPDCERWFLMKAVPMHYEGERHVLVVHLNITARKLAEQTLEGRNEQLELLTGLLSHDLRNPLQVAITSLDLAEDDAAATERIASSLDRMQEIIANGLLLARGASVDRQSAVTLRDTAASAWSHVDTAQATLDVAASRVLLADESLLEQVLENLFRNAVEHGPDAVTVTVGDLDDGFYVADDGPGIDQENQRAVFDSGFTDGATGGTGLGLAIVDEICTAHDWTVTVTESESGGARFEFTDVDVVAHAS